MELVMRNARVHGPPGLVAIAVAKGRIESVEPRLSGQAAAEIDAAGLRHTRPGLAPLARDPDDATDAPRPRSAPPEALPSDTVAV